MNVLVIALDTASPPDLRDADVLVVAPALNSRLRHWLSDEDGARRRAARRADACVEQLERSGAHASGRAARRADACVEQLERSGAHASGRVGDPDPLQAIADALPTFPADEVVIAAESEQVAERARKRFALPVLQARRPRPDSRAGPRRSS
jgi:hypothetical protein